MSNSIPQKNKMSYSKMDTYKQCNYKYKLTYVDGVKAWADTVATKFGTIIHNNEEAIANLIKEGKPIDYTQLKNALIVEAAGLERMFPKEYRAPDKSGKTYYEKLYAYLESGIYRLENFIKSNPNLEIVAAEQSFGFDYNGYYFNGKIDRIIKNKETGEYLLQDIKTWPEPAKEADLKVPLQFVFYVMAMKHLYGCDESAIKCQYDLPLCDLTQDAGSAGYMKKGVEKINKLLADIENSVASGVFVPNPTPLCHWCNFCPTNPHQPEAGKGYCPYYMKWTRENPTFYKQFAWEGQENHERILEEFRSELRANAKSPADGAMAQ